LQCVSHLPVVCRAVCRAFDLPIDDVAAPSPLGDAAPSGSGPSISCSAMVSAATSVGTEGSGLPSPHGWRHRRAQGESGISQPARAGRRRRMGRQHARGSGSAGACRNGRVVVGVRGGSGRLRSCARLRDLRSRGSVPCACAPAEKYPLAVGHAFGGYSISPALFLRHALKLGDGVFGHPVVVAASGNKQANAQAGRRAHGDVRRAVDVPDRKQPN
jgi:hypothetical protein